MPRARAVASRLQARPRTGQSQDFEGGRGVSRTRLRTGYWPGLLVRIIASPPPVLTRGLVAGLRLRSRAAVPLLLPR